MYALVRKFVRKGKGCILGAPDKCACCPGAGEPFGTCAWCARGTRRQQGQMKVTSPIVLTSDLFEMAGNCCCTCFSTKQCGHTEGKGKAADA